MSQKKHSHTGKILKGMTKRASKPNEETQKSRNSTVDGLREQYDVIREDILKLRDDIQKGYDMAKGAVEKKSLIGQLFKSR